MTLLGSETMVRMNKILRKEATSFIALRCISHLHVAYQTNAERHYDVALESNVLCYGKRVKYMLINLYIAFINAMFVSFKKKTNEPIKLS